MEKIERVMKFYFYQIYSANLFGNKIKYYT